MPNASLNSRASSPIVIPCRSGIGNCPTNDAYAGSQQVSFDLLAADRIGPVADDDVHAVARGGAHAVRHRVDVGVDARADVLQIDDQHVDVAQHLGASARASRCRASRSAPAAARRGRAASRSCCPAGRSGSRAAARRAPRRVTSGSSTQAVGACAGTRLSIDAGLQTTPTRRAGDQARDRCRAADRSRARWSAGAATVADMRGDYRPGLARAREAISSRAMKTPRRGVAVTIAAEPVEIVAIAADQNQSRSTWTRLADRVPRHGRAPRAADENRTGGGEQQPAARLRRLVGHRRSAP